MKLFGRTLMTLTLLANATVAIAEAPAKVAAPQAVPASVEKAIDGFAAARKAASAPVHAHASAPAPKPLATIDDIIASLPPDKPRPSEELPKRQNLTLDMQAILNQPIAPKKQDAPTPKPKPLAPTEKLERPKQYVVLSFDGSRSIQMWKEVRQLAAEENIGLTVFMSGVHFLPASLLKKYYDPPGDKYGPGTSAIRKIDDADKDTIPLRMEQVEESVGEGIEVGSHAVGHFDAGHGPGGLNWSTTDWVSELTQFQNILLNVFKLNSLPERYPGAAQAWKELIGDSLRGFRAPLLSTNGTLAPALEQLGYRYDGSEAYPMDWGKWPFKKKDANVWEIPMAQIPIAGTAKTQVAMDYNFYAFDSKATPDLTNSAFYQQRWVASLLNYFNHNYYGNRAPLHIGAHFDDYNGRAYFTGFFRFARMICHRPEVACITGSELVRKMQSLGPDRIAAYQHSQFPVLKPSKPLPDIKSIDLKIKWQASNGKIQLSAEGRDASRLSSQDLHVRVTVDNKTIASTLGEIELPMGSGIQQVSVRIFKDGGEVLSSTRRADVRAGLVHDIEFSDREELLKKGDLPGAHGLPDSSGLLPKLNET